MWDGERSVEFCIVWILAAWDEPYHDFNLILQRPNSNNIIARLKSPDSASLECLRLTFKTPVITCDMTSYMAWSLVSNIRIPLAQWISQRCLCETLVLKNVNRCSMKKKQVHVTSLTTELLRDFNTLTCIVNFQDCTKTLYRTFFEHLWHQAFLLWSLQEL